MASLLLVGGLLPGRAALGAPRTFVIDGNASTASAHVGKTGLGSFAGHEHVVVAQGIQGEVSFDAADLSKSAVDLVVNTRSLKVQEQNEPEGDPAQVQAAMRSPKVLDVSRFGTLHVGSTAVAGKMVAPDKYELVLSCEISLHGVTQQFKVSVQLEVRGDQLTASGKLPLKQTDFGIEPTSAAGGLVKVEDEVALTFRIVAKAQAP